MDLFYREQGTGYPVIILHGLFGSSDNWLTVTKSLSKDYKIYLIDQRNHGRSPHSNELDYTSMANDLNKFMSENNLQEAYLIGHSMGGKVAMKFAVENPDKVKKLVVVDIGPKYYPVHHGNILRALKALDLENITTRQLADEQLSEFIPELSVRQFLLKNLTRENDSFKWRINLSVIDKEIENIGEPLDPRRKFEKPSLFIRGGKSNYILDEDFEGIKEIFPNSQVKTIAAAGHWVQAEEPQEFLDIVNEFFKN